MPAATAKKHAAEPGVLATNRKARRNYHILERCEAGLVLIGTEVKSIRGGRTSLDESYVRIHEGEAFVSGMHIPVYEQGNRHNHAPTRERKLLLHRRELDRLHGMVSQKGCTLVPLKLYLKRGRIKMEVGVAKGKHLGDKREDLKRRTADREAERAIQAHRGRG